MDLFSFPPVAALLGAAYGALLGLAGILSPLAGSGAAAAAVVLVTLLVRAALVPVGISQARAEQTRARLAPKLRDLQRRHRRDPERLQRETMNLYRAENASPSAGCLPLLLQAPVVGVIYALFLHAEIAGGANALLAEQLCGVPLGTSLTGAIAGGVADLPTVLVIGALVLLIAAVAEVSRRMLRPPAPAEETRISSLGVRLAGILPFSTVVIALFLPLAAVLYLAVTVAWALAQRVVLRRHFPMP
jgi:YidC/Oxa1 family membrane protein insertase